MIKVPTIQQPYLEENMSNQASASNEASDMYPCPAFNQTQNQQVKRKRNQAGHPDPEAEVVALSPKTLMATNRFVCEVCNKGFQRDQNLQLHKRGHNLPWKLKQRIGDEIVRKKVYVCPESSCVHHEPSRALGDLTGIKKHFSRKHGEKKWKCERCSKKYAVLSDWKAHSKTCGTKEYRCDCGTLFSRRDSYITHRAFCDALAEEASRSSTQCNNNIITPFQSTPPNSHQLNLQQYQSQFTPIKQEQQQNFNLSQQIPPWLVSSSMVLRPSPVQDFSSQHDPSKMTTLPPYNSIPPSPHISATALLQKAAQMGAKTSCDESLTGNLFFSHSEHIGLNLSSHDEFIHSLASYGNKGTGGNASLLLHDMMMNNNPHPLHSSNGFGLLDDIGLDNGIINEAVSTKRKGNEGMTRDFLGLRPSSQSDIIVNSLSNCMNNNQSDDCNDNEDQC